jgi:hypothetical protein
MGLGKIERDARDPLIGRVLGGCTLEERIGRGGMGTVYRAIREVDRQTVAVKVLAPFMASDEAIVTRFTREVRAASRVRNPNVIRILGYSEQAGIHFTVMEYVDGENLEDVLKREGRLAVGRAAFIAREVARGLAALHAEGILHRDVKPSNILVGRDGSIRMTDFGIARDISDLTRLTAPGDLLGTLGFAAPEQLEESESDARADLYSLGATLHYMLSGSRPLAVPGSLPAPLGDEVPAEVRDLVERLLKRDPAARPADARSVASALSPFSTRPTRITFWTKCLRAALKLSGGGLTFWAGSLAASSHGAEFHPDPWSLVFPVREAALPSAALFGSGLLLAFFALVRGRERVGLGARAIVGFSLLAGALVTAYMAGAALGTLTLREAALSLISGSPQALFAESLVLAAIGLMVGIRRPGLVLTRAIGGALVLAALGTAAVASSAGSVTQAVKDLGEAMSQGGWTWGSFALAAAGTVLAYRHHGRLWPLFLAPVAVFVSVGLVYWASLGKGSPPLHEALTGPGGAIVLALLLALAARLTLDLRPRSGAGTDRETGTQGSSATPKPLS